MGVRGSNYGPYQSYPIPYGMQSSGNSWTQSEEQSYGQSRAMLDPYYNNQHPNLQPIPPDPYGWHIGQYMQNYMREVSFNDYSSQYTHDSTQRDDEDSQNFEPHRSSTWF